MSRMDFPSTNLVAGTTTHTVGDNTWLWNGYAWIKEPHGHTGAGVVDSICGVTGEICVCYPGLTITGQTLCIDRTATIHVAGISADESLNVRPVSGSYVKFPFSPSNQHFYIRGDGTNALYIEGGKLTVDGSNLELTEGSELIANSSISVGDSIVHIGDTDTNIKFTTNDIAFEAGGDGPVFGKFRSTFPEDVIFNAGISAANGSTFGGEVHFLSGISCGRGITAATIDAGVITASSHFSGTVVGNVYGNVTGNASSATVAGYTENIQVQGLDNDTVYRIPFVSHGGGGATENLGAKVDSGSEYEGIFFQPDISELTVGMVKTSGISAAAGATFAGPVRILDGPVGIGTSNPAAPLHVPVGLSAGGITADSINIGSMQIKLSEDGGASSHAEMEIWSEDAPMVQFQGHHALKLYLIGGCGLSADGTSSFGEYVTFHNQIRCNDQEVKEAQFTDYSETVNAGGSKSASFNVDFEDGNVQTFTFADDLTVSFTNPPATGIAGTVTLIITNGGANTTTWNAAVKWPGDNAPALTSSGVDIVTFTTIDAGTTIYGFVGGINFS